MFTCAFKNHASAIASEGRCLEPPYSAWGVLLEVFLLEKQNVVHPIAVTTAYRRAWVRRSSVLKLIVIVTIVIVNSWLRRATRPARLGGV